MRSEIRFTEDDKIAVIAPHPDDECLGVSAALLLVPEKTDIFVMTDGSHGDSEKSVEEEALIRKKQFENEMAYVKPHAWHWFGAEDTKLGENKSVADAIDFTPYTKIFLPWDASLHPDHRAAAKSCFRAISRQKAEGECYIYELLAAFHNPSHYIDITALVDEKRKLIRFHEDQAIQEDVVLPLNYLRGSQMIAHPEIKYAECFLKVNPYEKAYDNDIVFKLYEFNEDFGLYERLKEQGISIKCVMPCDITPVYDFIKDNFARAWADEALPAMISGGCYIAVRDRKILAFGCAEATGKNYAGPCGTLKDARGLGLYRAIMQRVLRHMKEKGYRYAIGGMVIPEVKNTLKSIAPFVEIEGSRGSYDDLLSR